MQIFFIDFHQGPPRTILQGPLRPVHKWPLLKSALQLPLVTSMSDCLCACLCLSGITRPIITKCLLHVTYAVTRPSSGGVGTSCVLPVLSDDVMRAHNSQGQEEAIGRGV